MIDWTLEMFKGQLDADTLFDKMTYRDMIALRDVREERLKKEHESQEEQMKREQAEEARMAARNRIMQK